ncbi:diaminopimelate epimerase [Thalassomonas haliotis]|uniref:Diaminopimelate epimerase n=1 Tax=Thalassomonas haliotis TaxID=485448 RepID=A0ABY7VDM5_9GAMM|nr:diaminopimelate epimerase [Thalassomonas haliotis]WDE11229.1 diaminopimelate epimerase [Thalassomonas haliotis]
MKFTKYHALGNDYLVVDPKEVNRLSQDDIITLCHRHYGIGSDGVLYGPLPGNSCDFALKIFNPDGSEAEKSGNGLRIFSRYLWDRQLVSSKPFFIETPGGVVSASVCPSGKSVTVEMGQVAFSHKVSEAATAAPEDILVLGKTFTGYRANVGNPHFVILVDELTPKLATTYGPLIESAAGFSNRTNVQFVKVLEQGKIQVEIWERGAGYTLASGSSSVAAAAVVHCLGLCREKISVLMPGGVIEITLDVRFNASMTGVVAKIAEGTLSQEALS